MLIQHSSNRNFYVYPKKGFNEIYSLLCNHSILIPHKHIAILMKTTNILDLPKLVQYHLSGKIHNSLRTSHMLIYERYKQFQSLFANVSIYKYRQDVIVIGAIKKSPKRTRPSFGVGMTYLGHTLQTKRFKTLRLLITEI